LNPNGVTEKAIQFSPQPSKSLILLGFLFPDTAKTFKYSQKSG